MFQNEINRPQAASHIGMSLRNYALRLNDLISWPCQNRSNARCDVPRRVRDTVDVDVFLAYLFLTHERELEPKQCILQAVIP